MVFVLFVSGTDIFEDKKSSGERGSPPPRGHKSKQDLPPGRRFISSILGGDVPYGSRGHVLTRAERKEYLPILPKEKSSDEKSLIAEEKPVLPAAEPLVLPRPTPRRITAPPPPRCHQVSVIQRTPLPQDKRKEISDVKLPVTMLIAEPEQEQPIDYHIPKRRGECEDEEEEKKILEQRRSSSSKIANSIIARPVIGGRGIVPPGKLPVLLVAAAGHGRSAGSGQAGGGQSGGGSTGGPGGGSGTSGGGAGSGPLGGGAGGGGMGGRDGRSNYGPNSPPTGSLPPFYESLKGGQNGINAYNANGNFLSPNNFSINSALNIDCDGGQDMGNGGFGDNQTDKQYSLLQNASYGIVMKDEIDLDCESKFDPSLGSNLSSYGGYDVNDSMMMDMAGNVMDPLQFTATLTFSSPAEHALLDSLSDAADLSNFLQRLPGDNSQQEIISDELQDTPSLTPDSVVNTSSESAIDSFSDQVMINRQYYPKNYLHQFPNHESPSNYPLSRDRSDLVMQLNTQQLLQQSGEGQLQQLQIQVQMQQHQSLSPGLSFSGSGLDLDSPTTMSLPSPGATSSLDGGSHHEPACLSPASVSGRRDSSTSEGKLQVLQHRVSITLIYWRSFNIVSNLNLIHSKYASYTKSICLL